VTKGTRVIGYVRVSTDEQGVNGGGVAAQRDAIEAEVKRRGWDLVDIYSDVASGGKDMKKRLGLAAAISAIESGDAAALVVSKLDRLSRSLLDFAGLMERAEKKGWEIVVLAEQFDMTTSSGRAMAGMLAVFAQWERDVIRERTRDALAAKRRAGTLKGTVGRAGWTSRSPNLIADDVRGRIVVLAGGGMSSSAIARLLNNERVPTAAGGVAWYPSTVKRVLDTAAR
jgi:DNA invertase Pin-like site-specific DNA recombinase